MIGEERRLLMVEGTDGERGETRLIEGKHSRIDMEQILAIDLKPHRSQAESETNFYRYSSRDAQRDQRDQRDHHQSSAKYSSSSRFLLEPSEFGAASTSFQKVRLCESLRRSVCAPDTLIGSTFVP